MATLNSLHKGSISIYFRFFVFLYHSTDLNEPYRLQACDISFFLISEQQESYKPS